MTATETLRDKIDAIVENPRLSPQQRLDLQLALIQGQPPEEYSAYLTYINTVAQNLAAENRFAT